MIASPPLSVLHVAVPGPAGGLESVVLELTAGLHSLGHRAVLAAVFTPDGQVPPLVTHAERAGVEVRRLAVAPRAYRREFRQLQHAIWELAPDVIHTHGYRADLIGGIAARRARVPWVSTVHGFTGGGRKNRFYQWLQTRSYRHAHRVVAVSHPLRRQLEGSGVPAPRIIVLPNGWSPKPALPREVARSRLQLTGEGPVIGWVGRLSREKGADVFLDALSSVSLSGARASIIGDGPDVLALRAQAVSLGVADRIRWHGLLPDAASLYHAFDLWVLSSRTEGTPISLFEAMSAGVPIVATSVGGVPDVISNEEGRLVPAEDPAAMAMAIEAALTDAVGSAARAMAARKRLKDHYGVDEWLAAHVSLYRTVLAGKGRLE